MGGEPVCSGEWGKKKWASDCNMLENKITYLKARVTQLGSQPADLAHIEQDLKDELSRTKA